MRKAETDPNAIKKNNHPSSLDDINLTNSMIVAESTSTNPEEDYNKLNCIGESQDSSVYRVQH